MNMKNLYIIICMLIISIAKMGAQTLNEICEIGLPVVIINTENNEEPTCEYVTAPEGAAGQSITNATKVPCSITIRLHDEILYESGIYKADSSGATIKIRGNTSATLQIKPYKLKLEKKADLLMRNNDSKYKDKEFLLLIAHKNQLRTYVGFSLNEIIDMPYKPSLRPVNVFLNDKYAGLYYLAESVKRNKDCRINVDKETGYIFEYDAYWWNEDYYIDTEFSNTAMKFTLKYPDTKDITEDQKTFIEQWLEDMQLAVLYGECEDYLNLDTCARWILAQDLLGISDGAGSNLYFAKPDDTYETKAYPATLWDFDCICITEDEWSSAHKSKFFFNYMFENDKNNTFATAYCKEWIKFSKDLVTEKLIKALNEYAVSDEGKAFEKSYNLSSLRYNSNDSSWSITDQVKEYKEWFTARKEWMDESINILYPDIMKFMQDQTLTHNLDFRNPFNKSYDILGRRVPSSYKGIKIINRKKVIVRE
ncbi:MAG: CotH kinase family protein [Paludibacteraceae bacterium]|nr:CotH kinase family protein [Paludibacteraceae bacterium]